MTNSPNQPSSSRPANEGGEPICPPCLPVDGHVSRGYEASSGAGNLSSPTQGAPQWAIQAATDISLLRKGGRHPDPDTDHELYIEEVASIIARLAQLEAAQPHPDTLRLDIIEKIPFNDWLPACPDGFIETRWEDTVRDVIDRFMPSSPAAGTGKEGETTQ